MLAALADSMPAGGAMALTIPAQPRPDATPLQRRIFDALRLALPDPWLLVHGAAWVGRSRPTLPLHDGAIDLLLAHPETGLLACSVVQGALLHDPSAGSWTQFGPDGKAVRVADPIARAQQAVAALLDKLAEHPLALPSRPTAGYGVILGDALAPARGFAPHVPSDVILDCTMLADLPAALQRLAQAWQARQPGPGNAASRWWWHALHDLFVQPQTARVLLRQQLADDQAAMVALSPQQLGVLDMLQRVRQQAIYGAAGTGKTLLAMHKARQLAAQGMRVVLTCYNRALGQHMARAMADVPNVVAMHFHELCYDLAGLDRRKWHAPSDHGAPKTQRAQFFDHELAEQLGLQGARQGGTFDALVVDEAQDFIAPWWTALDAWLKDPQRAVRYLFFDDAQQLRPDAAPVAGAEQALVLTTNWRNTQAIHRHLAQVAPHMAQLPCVGPQGQAVQYEPIRPNPGRALKRVLQRVCGEGGVKPEDVVVLTARAPQKSIWRDFADQLGPWKLTLGDEAGQIRLRGIRAFKGMEAPVVILTELEGETAELMPRLHYIGASRATALLVVLHDPDVAQPTAAA